MCSSSDATTQATARAPSQWRLPNSILVSGSISPPLFRDRAHRGHAREDRADDGSRIACDRNAEKECLHLLAHADQGATDTRHAAWRVRTLRTLHHLR